MWDFFRGWKRKVGVVTLFLACSLSAAWVRSSFLQESLNLPIGERSSVQIVSQCQSLNLFAIRAHLADPQLHIIDYSGEKLYDTVPHVQLGGMRFSGPKGYFHLQFQMDAQTWSVMLITLPYWMLVLPLTLLSAYLLLKKSRTRESGELPQSQA